MGVCTEKDNLAVVMEYVEGRDLGTIVHDRSVDISTKQKLHIAKGIAQGTPRTTLAIIVSVPTTFAR
jgi:serine/threonine protein kinase